MEVTVMEAAVNRCEAPGSLSLCLTHVSPSSFPPQGTLLMAADRVPVTPSGDAV